MEAVIIVENLPISGNLENLEKQLELSFSKYGFVKTRDSLHIPTVDVNETKFALLEFPSKQLALKAVRKRNKSSLGMSNQNRSKMIVHHFPNVSQLEIHNDGSFKSKFISRLVENEINNSRWSVADSPKAICGVILLIGPPGSGKSTLGRHLQRNAVRNTRFISTGDHLRALGLIDRQSREPNETTRNEIAATAHQLLRDACLGRLPVGSGDHRGYLQRATSPSSDNQPLLILEFVKEIEDAYYLIKFLKEIDVPLIQTLYIPGGSSASRVLAVSATLSEFSSIKRDQVRMVAERTSKWNRNASHLLELFSSLSTLSEINISETSRFCCHRSSSFPVQHADLSSHGYTSTQQGRDLDLQVIHGLALPKGLCCVPLHWVVSPRLVADRSLADSVLADAASFSGLRDLKSPAALPVPSVSISNQAEAAWVSWPDRYRVSRKCDGTRHLLIVSATGATHFLNRAGSLYAYPAVAGRGAGDDPRIPPASILDGELVWVGGRGFFLAFDALVAAADPVWRRPLAARLHSLESALRLDEAESCCELREAAGDAGARRGPSTRPQWPSLHSKQQAPPPGADAVVVLRKRHLAVSAEALDELEKARKGCPYPTDGLVFTPCAPPYVLGMAELLRKWQPADAVGIDIAVGLQLPDLPQKDIESDDSDESYRRHCLNRPKLLGDTGLPVWPEPEESFIPGLVYECLPNSTSSQASGSRSANRLSQSWSAVSIRWDKTRGNNPDAMSRLRQQQRAPLRHDDLVSAVRRAQASPTLLAATATPAFRPAPHPARGIPFERLHAAIMRAVDAGEVERTLDPATGLEVFNNHRVVSAKPSGSCVAAASGAAAAEPAIFAGEGPEGVVQATGPEESDVSNFPSLAGGGDDNCDKLRVGPTAIPADGDKADSEVVEPLSPALVRRICRGLVCHPASGRVVATPFPVFHQEGSLVGLKGSDQLADASVKVDGSLVVAFLWEGRPMAATKRRMDSEQARWAAGWLAARPAARGRMAPGWTYLFEAVGGDNAVVVPYGFEGLVLLGAVAPDGAAMAPGPRAALAEEMGVMAAPTLPGSLRQLVDRLPLGDEPRPSPEAGGPAAVEGRREPVCAASFEGWVLTLGDGSHHKLVGRAYRRASAAAQRVHPVTIWDRVRRGGEAPPALTAGLPAHLRGEVDAMLEALSRRFHAVWEAIRARAEGSPGEAQGPPPAPAPPDLSAPGGEGKGAGSPASPCAKTAAAEDSDDSARSDGLGPGPARQGLQLSEVQVDSGPTPPHPDGLEEGAAGGGEAAPEPPPTHSVGGGGGGDPGPVPAGEGSGDPGPAEALVHPEAFEEAVAAFLATQLPGGVRSSRPESRGRGPPSMYYSRPRPGGHGLPPPTRPDPGPAAATGGRARSMRVLLLDCIRPGEDGRLEGYAPSANARQTVAKGWPAGPAEPVPGGGGPPPPEPPIMAALDDGLLGLVFDVLPAPDAARAMMVCGRWREVVGSSPGFRARVAEFLEELAARAAAGGRYGASPPWSSNSDDAGSDYGGWHRAGWGGTWALGYGSP